MSPNYLLQREMGVKLLAIGRHDNVAMTQPGFGCGAARSWRMHKYSNLVRNWTQFGPYVA